MTRSIRVPRRAGVLLAAAAAGTTLLMSGCGAGQIAETAAMRPTSVGANAQSADNTFKIRSLSVDYLNTEGYPAGGDAPLNVVIYNDSGAAVTVRVSTESARSVVLAGGSAATPTPAGTTSASPSPSERSSASPSGSAGPTPTAAAPAGAPAEIKIPSAGFVVLNKGAGSWLQLIGLTAPLRPGESVQLRFDFNGTPIDTPAPVAVPQTPAPPATPVVGDEGGHEG